MAHGEIHLELSVTFADDEKVRALMSFGKRARPTRDLYVQMLCYCKAKMTDGKVPMDQVGILVYPDSLRDGLKDAALLVQVGLLQEVPGFGFYLPGFLKRNKSRAQIEEASKAKKAGATLGNHRRWHEDKPDPNCPHCVTTPIALPIGSPNPLLTRCDSTESESESETETTPSSSLRDDAFDEFWTAYPRKVGKQAARKAWDKALKTTTTDVILKAVVAYRDDPNQPDDRSLIPHPSTWLNEGRWDDEPLPPRVPRAAPWSRIPPGQEHLPEHERFIAVNQ